jgi:hypothetical protein
MITEAIYLPGSCWLCNTTRSISLAQIRFPGASIARCAELASPTESHSQHALVSIAPTSSTSGFAVRNITFVPFRPGSPRAERKLRDARYEKQIDTDLPSGPQGLRRARVAVMGYPPALATEALTGLLMPFWQLLIGLVVLVTVVVAAYRLVQRGPSRMGGAMLLVGGAVVCVAVFSYLVQTL